MTPSRQKMVEDMQLRGLSEKTQEAYVRAVFQARLVALAAATYRLGVQMGRRAAIADVYGADVALATAQVESLRQQQVHLADMAIRLAALARGMTLPEETSPLPLATWDCAQGSERINRKITRDVCVKPVFSLPVASTRDAARGIARRPRGL